MEKYLQFKIILGFQAFLILSLILMGYLIAAKINDVIDDSIDFDKMNNGDTNG
jgi:hypothetical protein